MSRCIILPDIHLKIEKVDSILSYEDKYDKVIYINDLWDQFFDTPEQNRNAAIWLKEKLKDDKNIFLWSNHVQSYAYDFNSNMFCSGFTKEKSLRIWEILNRDDFNKLKLYYIEQGILFTHAGLSDRLIKLQSNGETIDTLEKVEKFLDRNYEKAKFSLEAGGDHWLFAAGYDRGGTQKVGGLTWVDWGTFVPTPFAQILGHSPLETPCFLTKSKKGGLSRFAAKAAKIHDFNDKDWALNLDTHLNDYAILDNGILTIKNIIWKADWKSNLPEKNEIKTTIQLFKGKIV